MIVKAAIGQHVYRYETTDGFIIASQPSRKQGANFIFGRLETNRYKIISLKANKDNWLFWNVSYTQNKVSTKETFAKIEEHFKELGVIKSAKEVDGKEFARTILLKERMYEPWFKKYFPELDTALSEDTTSLKVGKVTIIPQTVIKETEIDDIKEFVALAEKYLKVFNLQDLLYGNVYIMSTLGSKAIADYTPATDTIRLSKKARKDKNDVKTFLHELAHRAMHKDLIKRTLVFDKFNEASKFGLDVKINVGDKFKDNQDQLFQIVDKTIRYPRIYYIIKYDKVDDKKFRVDKNSFIHFKKESGEPAVEHNEWFPTAYSRKNLSEWFSEVFSIGLVTNNSLYIDFVKSVIK